MLTLAGAAASRGADALPPPVPGFPIGRCVRVIGVTAPEDAKTVGFEYLELALQDMLPLSAAELQRTAMRLHALQIPLLSGYGFLPAELKVVGSDADASAIDEQVERGLQIAARFGLQMVVFGNLNGPNRTIPHAFSQAEARRQLLRFGQSAAQAARRHGITVLFEPLPGNSTNLINTVAEGLELVEAVNDANFQLLVDYSYMVIGGEDMAILHKAGRHIRQIEISNPNGRVYPRSADEAGYASFFQALRRGNYRGGFSIHGRPENFFVDAPRAIALLRRLADQFLNPGLKG
jgi:sugar phosphate isomerase/epimerase